MFLKSKLYALILLFSYVTINAISSEAIVAQKDGHEIIFIKDRHIDLKDKKKGPVQRDALLDHCVLLNEDAQSDSDKVLLVTEDNHFYDGPNVNTKKFIDKMSAYLGEKSKKETRATSMQTTDDDVEIVGDSILASLAQQSMNLGIDCYNAECRQVGYASESDDAVTGNDIVIEFERNTNQIMQDLELIKKEASENPDAQIFYDACSKIMQDGQEVSKELIEKLRGSSVSTRQLLAQGELDNSNNFLDLYDRYLIDARILLGWYKNKDRKKVIIAAGFSHIERILPVFENMGYTTSTYGKKYDDRLEMVKNCLDINDFFNQLHNKTDNPQSLLT